MPNYITIDSGTTNTRICLVDNYKITDCLSYAVGAKNGTDELKKVIKDGINELLIKNKLSNKDIKRILASGMLTSELGLIHLPHINAPAGITELSENMYHIVLEDISLIPFSFIRGVKTTGRS